MRTTIIASAAVAPLGVALAIASAATASAADPTVAGFGSREQLYDAGGSVVAGWTVSDLRPSSDIIPYPVAGRLYEATASVEADQGAVTPIVSNLNARATDGTTYRALYNVATPQGVNPATLSPGAKSTGKIYFDVIGANPNSVVYNDSVQDLLIWTSGASSPAAQAPAAPPAANPPAANPPAANPPAANPPAAPPAPAAPPPAAAPGSPAPAAAPAATTPSASGSLPSGTSPGGGSTTGISGNMNFGGSAGSGGNPASGTSSGVTGMSPGSAGPGGNPAGRT
jgi:Domain of unknown function (DUF1942)